MLRLGPTLLLAAVVALIVTFAAAFHEWTSGLLMLALVGAIVALFHDAFRPGGFA